MAEINLYRRRLLAAGLSSAFTGLCAPGEAVSAVTRWSPSSSAGFDYVELTVPETDFDSLSESLLSLLDDSCGSALGSIIFNHGVVADLNMPAAKVYDRVAPANARTTNLATHLRTCARDLVTAPTPRTTILGLRHASASDPRCWMQPDGNGLSNLSFRQNRQLRERLSGRSATFVLLTNGPPTDRVLCRVPCRPSDLSMLLKGWQATRSLERPTDRRYSPRAAVKDKPNSGVCDESDVSQIAITQSDTDVTVLFDARSRGLTIRNPFAFAVPIEITDPDIPRIGRRYILAPFSTIADTLPGNWHARRMLANSVYQPI